MKFKVGDKVKIIGGPSGKVGGIGKIVRDDGYGTYVVSVKGENFYKAGVHIKLVGGKEVTMKNTKWGVKFDKDDDSVEFSKSKKKAQERISELLDDSEVDKKSLWLFKVGERFKVERPISYKLVAVK